jgi:hypothetical protein
MAAASVACRVRSFTFFQFAVAAVWGALRILFLWTFAVAVTTPAPQAARRLPAVLPDMTKALAIVALGHPYITFIGPNRKHRL